MPGKHHIPRAGKRRDYPALNRKNMTNQNQTISPLDGRYAKKLTPLLQYFSENALMRCRVRIEIEYFIRLWPLVIDKARKNLDKTYADRLRRAYKNFSENDFQAIKKIEKKLNHDIKAVEYFVKRKITETCLGRYKEYAHFGLTSEDINNIAYTLLWKEALNGIYLQTLSLIKNNIATLAKKYKNQPMLALTHGQSASPTTVGKEFAVFGERLKRKIIQLQKQRYLAKFSGATGTFAALAVSFPKINWPEFAKKFIKSFGLEPNLFTTQIEPHDSLIESFQIIDHVNSILLDFCQDLWLYISRGILGQKKVANEVGSSAMPHKINPIYFENAEGNLGLANALFEYFIRKLPISRLQRDLSDSTVLRNLGVALGHSLLAYESILEGLSRLSVNTLALDEELNNHFEVLAEPIQTILKKLGYKKPYEKLKELSRGNKITKNDIRKFINDLGIPEEAKKTLLNLTPHNYTGLCGQLKYE